MTIRILTKLSILLVACHTLIAAQLPEDFGNKFEQLASQYTEVYDIPGWAVAVIKDGQIAYSKCHGVANLRTMREVDNNTLFKIASISKVFTATAVMQLVDQGKITLDDPVYKHIPYFRLKDDRYKLITIRQLLSHMSGLADGYKGNYGYGQPTFNDGDIKKAIMGWSEHDLEFDPGTRQSYCNNGFVLLSVLVQEVSGQSFEVYVRENILKPLKMTSSSFSWLEIDTTNLAAEHVLGDNFQNDVLVPYPVTRWLMGADGLFTNLNDLSRFLIAMLNEGTVDGQSILSPQSYESMTTVGEGSENIGLGWMVREVWGGRKLISHGGTSNGSCSMIAFVPRDSMAVLVLCNNRNGQGLRFLRDALKLALDMEVKDVETPTNMEILRTFKENGVRAGLDRCQKLIDSTGSDGVSTILYDVAYPITISNNRDKYDIAKSLFEMSIKIDSSNAILHDMLGEMYLRLTIEQYGRAAELDSTSWGTNRMIKQISEIDLDFYY